MAVDPDPTGTTEFHRLLQRRLSPDMVEERPTLQGLERSLRHCAETQVYRADRMQLLPLYVMTKELFRQARRLVIRPGSRWHSNVRSLLQTFATLGGLLALMMLCIKASQQQTKEVAPMLDPRWTASVYYDAPLEIGMEAAGEGIFRACWGFPDGTQATGVQYLL